MDCARCGRALKRDGVTMADGRVMGPVCAKLEGREAALRQQRDDDWFSSHPAVTVTVPSVVVEVAPLPWWRKVWNWLWD